MMQLGTGTATYAVQQGLCCGFMHMVVSSRPLDNAADWRLVHSISCHCTAFAPDTRRSSEQHLLFD